MPEGARSARRSTTCWHEPAAEAAGPRRGADAAGVLGRRRGRGRTLMTITWSSSSTLVEMSGPGVTKAVDAGQLLAPSSGSRPRTWSRSATCPTTCRCWRGPALSYAMADAHPTVREAADHVAPATTRTGWRGAGWHLRPVICCDAPVLARLPAADGSRRSRRARRGRACRRRPRRGGAPCKFQSVADSTKAAMAVFTGEVTDVTREERPGRPARCVLPARRHRHPGLPGRDRHRDRPGPHHHGAALGPGVRARQARRPRRRTCSWSGPPVTRGSPPATAVRRPRTRDLVAQVERLLGAGRPPVEPSPEPAEFTVVATDEPTTLLRAAAPGPGHGADRPARADAGALADPPRLATG